jgi:hypothetical protein
MYLAPASANATGEFMRSSTAGIVTSFIAALALVGCASHGGGAAPQADKGATAPVTVAPITVILPNDPGIRPSLSGTPYSRVQFGENNPPCNPAANGNNIFRLYQMPLSPASFIVHSRHDNCVAGSGVKYVVNYTRTETPAGLTLTLQPVERSTYQEGLIMKFPVPGFDDRALVGYLEEPMVSYEFEVNSTFNKDAVFANFVRLAANRYGRPEQGAATLNLKDRFAIQINGRLVELGVSVFPYRDGSKATIHAFIPGIETSPSTIDYGKLFDTVKAQVTAIVNS